MTDHELGADGDGTQTDGDSPDRNADDSDSSGRDGGDIRGRSDGARDGETDPEDAASDPLDGRSVRFAEGEAITGPESEPARQADGDGETDARSARPDAGEPLADLAASVAERDDRSAGPSSDADELFDREVVPEIDEDRLWERLESDEPPDPDPPDADREIREIDAQQYCHRCEHFAEPPDVGCTLEGTEILAMPSLETFRVADCPVVLEDEELEEEY